MIKALYQGGICLVIRYYLNVDFSTLVGILNQRLIKSKPLFDTFAGSGGIVLNDNNQTFTALLGDFYNQEKVNNNEKNLTFKSRQRLDRLIP